MNIGDTDLLVDVAIQVFLEDEYLNHGNNKESIPYIARSEKHVVNSGDIKRFFSEWTFDVSKIDSYLIDLDKYRDNLPFGNLTLETTSGETGKTIVKHGRFFLLSNFNDEDGGYMVTTNTIGHDRNLYIQPSDFNGDDLVYKKDYGPLIQLSH